MDTPQIKDGAFEARYFAFLETIKELRPKLHGYGSRMTGASGLAVIREFAGTNVPVRAFVRHAAKALRKETL